LCLQASSFKLSYTPPVIVYVTVRLVLLTTPAAAVADRL
jgi:hypothetical protein